MIEEIPRRRTGEAAGVRHQLAPLLHGVIDRRVAHLTEATQVVGQRVTQDPGALYREMRTWPDVRPEDAEAFRLAFSVGDGAP